MINDIEHILYTSCYLYVLLDEVCIQPFSPFFNGTVNLFIIQFMCCIYFLDKVLYYIYILKIITLSLCLPFFYLVKGDFKTEKNSILINLKLSSIFKIPAFCVLSEKSSPNQGAVFYYVLFFHKFHRFRLYNLVCDPLL